MTSEMVTTGYGTAEEEPTADPGADVKVLRLTEKLNITPQDGCWENITAEFCLFSLSNMFMTTNEKQSKL